LKGYSGTASKFKIGVVVTSMMLLLD
jgi:hypothetical protein